MHVILTCNFSPWSRYSGGGQRSTHNVATHLVARGHEVAVVYTKPPWEKPPVPAGVGYSITWATLPAVRSAGGLWFRNFSTLSVRNAVALLLRDGSVVHANGEESAALYQLRNQRRFAFVLTPRFPKYPDRLIRLPGERRLRSLDLLVRDKFGVLAWAFQHADRVFPTSQYSQDEIRVRYAVDEERLAVIPNGVARVFLAEEAPTLDPEAPVLFFGRLERSKGVHVLLEALERLPSSVRCTLVGRGSEERAVQSRIASPPLAGRVDLRGWACQSELAAAIRASSLVCLPSLEESFGNAVAEAMACGVPVVSTCTGSVPELVRHGITGCLVPPNDPAALARGIAAVLDDPAAAARLGAQARADVSSRFRWENVVGQYEQNYREVLTQTAAGG